MLFDRHAPAIGRYVARRLGPDTADDLVAETFLVAFRRRGRYDLAYGDARPWLYGIATRLIGRYSSSWVPGGPRRGGDSLRVVAWPDPPSADDVCVSFKRLFLAGRRGFSTDGGLTQGPGARPLAVRSSPGNAPTSQDAVRMC